MVDSAHGLLSTAQTYAAFLDRLCTLTDQLPAQMRRCWLGLSAITFGQVIVLLFHVRYYTVWYYEEALRQRRRARKRAGARPEAADAAKEYTGGHTARVAPHPAATNL